MIGGGGSQDKLTRIAIVNSDKCKPKKCRQECKKSCPVVRQGEYVSLSQLGQFILYACCLFVFKVKSKVILDTSIWQNYFLFQTFRYFAAFCLGGLFPVHAIFFAQVANIILLFNIFPLNKHTCFFVLQNIELYLVLYDCLMRQIQQS